MAMTLKAPPARDGWAQRWARAGKLGEGWRVRASKTLPPGYRASVGSAILVEIPIAEFEEHQARKRRAAEQQLASIGAQPPEVARRRS